MGVTEGCLRFHFRKSTSPRKVRRLAFEWFHAQPALAMLTEADRRAVERLVKKAQANPASL